MIAIGPTFRALLRNKVGALLLALQIALTMTVVVNAIHVISSRGDLMSRPSGLDEANQFYLTSTGYASNFNEALVVAEDLRQLRALPAVAGAIQTNATPLGSSGWSTGLSLSMDEQASGVGAAVYFVDETGLDTLGVKLIAGRNFRANEIGEREKNAIDWPSQIIVTEATAAGLFPDLSPAQVVGKSVYISSTSQTTIIGVIDRLQAPWNGWSGVERSMLIPQRTLFGSSRYFIRAQPGQLNQAMRAVQDHLDQHPQGRLIRNVRTMDETRARSYRDDQALQGVLWVTMTALVIITALGIIGMVSFNVNRRRKQIGTRRALGASRNDIIGYFMLENLLTTVVGLVLGSVSSILLNIWLVDTFNLPRIGWLYLPVAMLLLIVVGLLAVYGPARKAAAISPALATRQ
ncbi:ABC transporter permease [Idiomarina xiamenensis]|uniref:ABC transporter permease n=1 Tax=Idiomarina xiamenensis 10-D-4 TaxID=740709 RepID=K2JWF6_9GAMM|nr:FtsX-like permease family protein [Idiomarina xiamenensis]EKE87671.1 hypothetical protein A10D4_01215 [Idiomarina xiamenensis 10-D-4]